MPISPSNPQRTSVRLKSVAPAKRPVVAEDDQPPPIRSNRLKIIGLISLSFLVAVMLFLVVLNLDKPREAMSHPDAGPDVKPLIPPQLTNEDMRASSPNFERDPGTIHAHRGQIQTKENGRLRQYSFAELDPLPAGMSHMIEPRIEAHLSDDRVMTLESDSALVHMPAKSPDSGTMTGHVVIRLYTLASPNQQFDPATMTPSMEVHTDEAAFNNMQGEVTCAGWVDIQTATAHLPGSGLRMQINEIEHRPQLFAMAQAGPILLSGMSKGNSAATSQPEASPPREPQSRPERAPKPRKERSNDSAAPASRPKNDRPNRRARTNQPPAPKAAAARTPAPFYFLTLTENVHILQGDGTTGWNADGDELHIIFSMQSKGLSDSLAGADRFELSTPFFPTPPSSMRTNLAALTLASYQSSDDYTGLYQPSDDEVTITCTGGLTMVPLADGVDKPESPDDARFELIGKPVHLHNQVQATNVTCSTLIYQTLSQKLRLEGLGETPLTIDSPELYAEGERLLFNRLDNVGAFDGPGWMTAKQHPPATDAATQPASNDQLPADLRIQWQQGVAMAFEKPAEKPAPSPEASSNANKLHQATFNGEVQVTSNDLSMRSDKMIVGFPSSPPAAPAGAETIATSAPAGAAAGTDQSQQRGIESILASGSVRAVSLSDKGSLNCDDLDVRFTRGADGKSVPVKLTATSNVQAIDQQSQTLLSNLLIVNFKPPDPANAPATTQPQSGGLRRRAVEVDTLNASDNVQVIMADGARAFADKLEGDSASQTMKLLGEDVMVVSDRAVIHHGKLLELHKAENKAYWPGPGEFLYYAASLVANNRERIERPQLDQIDSKVNPVQTRAEWSDSMTYDSAFNDGAGSILLSGNVDASSTPSGLERDTMNGQSLTLEFYNTPVAATQVSTTNPATEPSAASAPAIPKPAATAPADPAATSPAGNSNPFAGGRRQLNRFIAEGDAKLESRTWVDPTHADKPRVYFVEGPIVTYDALTLEGFVQGAGQLLMRDERATSPGGAASQPHVQSQVSAPFSGKGTTSFRWTDHLQMTRRPDGLYNIDMVGNLQMLHSALDQSISTVVSDRLQAVVARSAAAQNAQHDNGLDLGGSMEIKQLRADGRAYIHTPTRDIDCETFDYDYTTGLAILTAQPGRTVAITTKGNPDPLHAQRVAWDLNQDKITATNVSGAAPK